MSNKENDAIHKIIFAGTVGAGKTQAVRTLSDKEVLTTEEHASDATKNFKPTTTVAMDYGIIQLDTGEKVHLYGTPGQQRFDFMWDILSENAGGVVLLVNATSPNPSQDLHDYLQNFLPLAKDSKFIVGITHAETMPQALPQQLTGELQRQGIQADVLAVDARDKAEMRHLVNTLLAKIA